jgi:hypothetical protein
MKSVNLQRDDIMSVADRIEAQQAMLRTRTHLAPHRAKLYTPRLANMDRTARVSTATVPSDSHD